MQDYLCLSQQCSNLHLPPRSQAVRCMQRIQSETCDTGGTKHHHSHSFRSGYYYFHRHASSLMVKPIIPHQQRHTLPLRSSFLRTITLGWKRHGITSRYYQDLTSGQKWLIPNRNLAAYYADAPTSPMRHDVRRCVPTPCRWFNYMYLTRSPLLISLHALHSILLGHKPCPLRNLLLTHTLGLKSTL